MITCATWADLYWVVQAIYYSRLSWRDCTTVSLLDADRSVAINYNQKFIIGLFLVQVSILFLSFFFSLLAAAVKHHESPWIC